MVTDSTPVDQKITVTYLTQGDLRRIVLYMGTGDGVQSDGSLGGPLTTIIQKFAACIPHGDRIVSIVGHNPDKSVASAAPGFPQNTSTLSFNPAMSSLAYHFVMKDEAGRNCGHTVHEVAQSDTANALLQTGENISNINQGAAWLAFTDSLVNHTFTKSHKAYVSLMHVRLVMKRDRQTGGRGRSLTTKGAIKFLEKHDPAALTHPIVIPPA